MMRLLVGEEYILNGFYTYMVYGLKCLIFPYKKKPLHINYIY